MYVKPAVAVGIGRTANASALKQMWVSGTLPRFELPSGRGWITQSPAVDIVLSHLGMLSYVSLRRRTKPRKTSPEIVARCCQGLGRVSVQSA